MNDNEVHEIGGRLKEFRLSLGFHQQDLAAVLGVKRQTVSKWELGKSIPSGDELLQLGRLGMSLDYVILNIRNVPVSSYARLQRLRVVEATEPIPG